MDYSKYGISESYLPTVYHNRIVIDKTTAATVNKNLIQSPYINVGTGPMGFLGNPSNSPIQTLVTVDMNIVFNVPSYADFVKLTKDDDFGNSFNVITHLCWRDVNKGVNDNPTFQKLPSKYADQLVDMISNINSYDYQINSLTTVFNNISKDSLNLSSFDNFTRYQREFPDGQTYFQVPYTIKFQVPLENIPYMYLLSFVSVTDFDIDLSLNFGGFEIDDDSITSVSAIEAYNLSSGDGFNTGPLIIDTLINNNNTQTKGVFYTIAQNQSTYQGQEPPEGVDVDLITQQDLIREEQFNDFKGTAWLGGVHKHAGRYMAGSTHTDEPHAYLDENIVNNKKLIDLRPIKEVKKLKFDFSPYLKYVKKTKINYFDDDSKDDFLEKLTIISDPLLSTNRSSNIDGFFTINYTNFLRKHSIFSNLLEKENVITKLRDQQVSYSISTGVSYNYLSLIDAVQNTLKIRVLRHDVKSKISKLIFDSSRAEDDGIFYERANLESKKFSGNLNNVKTPLGYLNVVDVAQDVLGINEEYSILEFYNFTDLDDKKAPNTQYKYEIEIEMTDPVFLYLSNGIRALDRAIGGHGMASPAGGSTTLGLRQVLNMLKTMKGQPNVLAKGGPFYYNTDGLNPDAINGVSNSTILDAIKEYDRIEQVESIKIDDVTGEPRLVVLDQVYKSGILGAIGSMNEALLGAFVLTTNYITDLEDAGNTSIDLLRLVINTLSSIRDNLKDAVNAISNVDIGTQAFGYRARSVSLSFIGGNLNKRIIREKIISDNSIETQQYGFDYLGFVREENIGLKQVPSKDLQTLIENGLLPRFYNTTQSNNYSQLLSAYLQNYGYSTLTLYRPGVVLPEGFFTSSDYENWRNLLQLLLLFIEKNASKLTRNSVFTYTPNDTGKFKFDINKNLNIEENFGLLKSLDRSQKQLTTKGLDIQNKIKTNQSIFVEYNDEIQTDQQDPDSAIEVQNLKTNSISDYFLSYVNNAVENGDENKNRNLNGLQNLTLVSTDDLKEYTIPVISLLEYITENSNILGEPAPGVSYRDYYENNVWSPQTKKLFLDQFADFFFDFVNSIKIEYLSGFDTYNYTGILDEINQSPVDQFNNINISSYKWEQLTNSALSNLPVKSVLLCKMVDFVSDAFGSTNIPLVQKLKFYKKYYNYFLIIKGPKDLQIKTFGSSI